MRYFRPYLHYDSYKDIDFDLLKSRGINNIFLDIDNTLVPHDVLDPTLEVKMYVEGLINAGFKVYLISNNNESRVKRFAAGLKVPCFWFALKPLKRTYKKIIKEYKIDLNSIACVGDQLLTDVLGANRLGLFSIYTKPLVSKDITFTKFNRLIERSIIKRLKAKGLLDKGVLYE